MLDSTNMPSNTEQEGTSPQSFDPSIQTENIAFHRAEMIGCPRCHRNNPPTRLKCLYCASDLELPIDRAASIDAELRKIEPWESGVNIILRRASKDADLKRVARLLSLENEDLTTIAAAGIELPLARVEDLKEANKTISRLGSLGFDCFPVSDETLAIDEPNIRIGAIEFPPTEFGVKNLNTGHFNCFAPYEISVIVEGLISKTKVDTIEKRRLRGESKLVDQSSIADDDRILDIYPADQTTGYRLLATGFDFSCLGDQKGLLARENWGRLIDLLKAKLPSAKFVSDHAKVREYLEPVWPTQARNETKGMIQTGFGKREFGSVTTANNLEQFNRYSRLQRHLL